MNHLVLIRSRGAPDERVLEFDGDPEAGYMLDVTDESGGDLTGRISLNGDYVVTQGEFDVEGGLHVHRPVPVQDHNRLVVRLEGKPGSSLSLELRGGVAVLGTAGGELRHPGGKVWVTIPPGALGGETELSIKRTEVPATPTFLGSYDLEPSGIQFKVPVVLHTKVSPEERETAGEGGWPFTLAHQHPGDTTWSFIEGSGYDSLAGLASAPLEHFSEYGEIILPFNDFKCASVVYNQPWSPPAPLPCQRQGIDTPFVVGPQGLLTGLAAYVEHTYGELWLIGVIPSCYNTGSLRYCLPGLQAVSEDPSIAYRDETGFVRGFRNGYVTMLIWHGILGAKDFIVSGVESNVPPSSGGWVGTGNASDIAINNFKVSLLRGQFPSGGGLFNAGWYKSYPALFGGGLNVGLSSSQVMYGYDFRFAGTGWVPLGPPDLVPAGQRVADHQTIASLCPNSFLASSGYLLPPELGITQETFAWVPAPDDDYVLVRYTFFNFGGTTMTGLYAALGLDWDLGQGIYINNSYSRYDPLGQLALEYFAAYATAEPIVAHPLVGLGTLQPMTSYYPTSPGYFSAGQLIRAQPTNAAEWFAAISTGIHAELPVRTDAGHIAGVGPLSIASGGRTSVTFILSGGDDLNDLRANIARARQRAAALPQYLGAGQVCQ